MVPPGRRAPLEVLELTEPQEFKDNLEPMVCQVLLEHQGRLEPQVRVGIQVLREPQDKPVHLE